MLTTVLNLAALLTGLTLALLGVRLLARRLGAVADAAEMACGHCGHPAAALTDFTCPGCKRDVREDGVHVRARGAAAGPRHGRAAVAWTALVLVLACVVTVGMGERVRGVVLTRQAENLWSGDAPLRSLRCVAVERRGSGSGGGADPAPRATGAAEVLLADGRFITLEVDGAGDERATAWDDSGTQVFTGRAFDARAVRDWLAASAPSDLSGAELDAWAAVLFREIAEQTLPIGRAASLGASFPRPRRVMVLSFTSTSSSSASSSREPWPAGLLQCAVVLWPLTWLAGIAALLPAQGRPAAAGGPPA